ncbi:MAG: hypothetical protein LW850_34280, partial [Planctomycetaceae bacterium]|nr:hypothetical protein [Planctomycetaceae bacterium]
MSRPYGDVSVHEPENWIPCTGLFGGRFKVRPCFYPSSLKESPLMSNVTSSKAAQLWAERIAQ